MNKFLNKLTSRKFLTCIVGVVMGVCMVFGVDEGDVSTIAGAVTAVVSIVSYIQTEGKIDANAVGQIKDAADDVKDAIDVVEKIEE